MLENPTVLRSSLCPMTVMFKTGTLSHKENRTGLGAFGKHFLLEWCILKVMVYPEYLALRKCKFQGFVGV